MFVRKGYSGLFLPGYKAPINEDVLLATLPETGIYFVDHVVGNQPDLKMEDTGKQKKTINAVQNYSNNNNLV